MFWEGRFDSLFLRLKNWQRSPGSLPFIVRMVREPQWNRTPVLRVFILFFIMEYAVRHSLFANYFPRPPPSDRPHPLVILRNRRARPEYMCLHVRPPHQAIECWTGRPRIAQKTVQREQYHPLRIKS